LTLLFLGHTIGARDKPSQTFFFAFMKLRRLRKILVRMRRHFVVEPTLVGYLTMALGIPCPAAQSLKDTSQPFPCQQRLCGCMNAEQCWKYCCCFTLGERLAWAQGNQVNPPAYVPGSSSSSDQKPVGNCCGSGGKCGHCPENNSSPTQKPHFSEEDPPPASKAPQWPTGFFARHCGSQGDLWINASPVATPEALSKWNFEWTPLDWVPFADFLPPVLVIPPPVPPPRG
jgi:hypothetical protein